MKQIIVLLVGLPLFSCSENTKQREEEQTFVAIQAPLPLPVDSTTVEVVDKPNEYVPLLTNNQVYIDRAHYFSETNEFYIDASLKGNFEELISHLDSTMYEDNEYKRQRVNKQVIKDNFDLNGIADIEVFNSKNKKVANGKFRRVEYMEDMIFSRYIFVFSSSGYEIEGSEEFYVIGGTSKNIQELKTERIKDEGFKKSLLQKFQSGKPYTWALNSVRDLTNNTIYSVVSFGTKDFENQSYLIETNNGEDNVELQFSEDYVLSDILPTRIMLNEMPVLLAECSVPDTDHIWNSLIVFNGSEYLLSEKKLLGLPGLPNEIERISDVFYKELVTRNRGPHEAKNENGIVYLDIERYVDYLLSQGIYSQAFIDHEIERTRQCQEDIEKMNYSGETDLGWEPNSCGFFNYYYWLKSQEYPTNHKLSSVKLIGTTAEAYLQLYDVFDGKEHHWSGLKMSYILNGREWKIDGVEFY